MDTRWRHQMETFSALLAICAGNSPVPGEFPAQRPVTRSFDVFFDLRLNKRLNKQSWGWWFMTQSCPLWRHRNEQNTYKNWNIPEHNNDDIMTYEGLHDFSGWKTPLPLRLLVSPMLITGLLISDNKHHWSISTAFVFYHAFIKVVIISLIVT